MRHASSSQIDVVLPAQLGARFSLKNGSMVFIPLLFYAFFCQSLASSSVVLYACLAVSFVSLVMHFLANGRFANKKFGLEVAWVPFFILFYVHSFVFGVNNLTLLVVYSILFVCMYAASGEKEWISTCIKVLVAFAAFHATCTIAFWLFPSLYAPVKAVFFSSSYMASDYRSGFTAHYSTNSIYLSFGLVCWACGYGVSAGLVLDDEARTACRIHRCCFDMLPLRQQGQVHGYGVESPDYRYIGYSCRERIGDVRAGRRGNPSKIRRAV